MILLVGLLFRAFSRSDEYSVEFEMPTLVAILGIRLKGPKEQIHLRGPQGQDITEARRAELFAGGLAGLGPPRKFFENGV